MMNGTSYFKSRRTTPKIVITCWDDVSANIMEVLLGFVDDSNDVIRMEYVCRRWRDIIRHDKMLDKGYWKKLCEKEIYDSKFKNVELRTRYITRETPEIIEWYKSSKYRTWRDFYRKLHNLKEDFKHEYFTIYPNWLLWRYNISQTNNRFDLYFDVYVLYECMDCKGHCKVYEKLGIQKLVLSPSDCSYNDFNLSLVFKPMKGSNVYGIGCVPDDERNYHRSKCSIKFIHRYHGKVVQEVIQRSRFLLDLKRSILSRRQRQKMGKILRGNEDAFMVESSRNSVITHSNAKNTEYYSRQSNYENRTSQGYLLNLTDIDIVEVETLKYSVGGSYLYKIFHA